MALLEIKKYPEKILTQKAEPVTTINGEVQKLIDDMTETMYAAPGIGLAAPQVGISKRIAVIDISPGESTFPLYVFINPVIISVEGLIEVEEGCLSIPEFTTKIGRAEKVLVSSLDREGKKIEMEAEGILAFALQHEIDHLEGTLLIDRISSLKREFFKKRYRKQSLKTK
jgi:peptide deformylase